MGCDESFICYNETTVEVRNGLVITSHLFYVDVVSPSHNPDAVLANLY